MRVAHTVAVLAVLAVLATTACSRGGSDGLPTITKADVATQNAYAQASADLTWPQGFRDDPTGTVCAGYSDRCARTLLSSRLAVTQVSAVLAQDGVQRGSTRCGSAGPEPFDLPGISTPADGCSMTIEHGHALMKIMAWNRFTLAKASSTASARTLDLGYTGVSIWALPGSATGVVRATTPSEPDQSLDRADARVIAHWGTPTCDRHTASGCVNDYVSVPVSADPVAATEQAGRVFAEAGFGIVSAQCTPSSAAAAHVDCQVAARHTASNAIFGVFVLARFSTGRTGYVGIRSASAHD